MEAMMKTETDTKTRYEGIIALQHFINHGIKLIGVYDSGAAIASGNDYHNAFTSNITEIQNLMAGRGDSAGRAAGTPINRFRFIPKDAGLICIDIDRGHTNEIDGLVEFYQMFEQDGIYRPGLTRSLQHIENDSFPAYTATPNNGFHLYFRYQGQKRFKHSAIAPNVEVFHANACLTVPGSIKSGKPYIFYGDLNHVPELYPMLERRFSLYQGEHPPVFSPLPPKKERGIPSLDRIAEWTINDGPYSGKNELCFQIALRAARPVYTYTENEVVMFLQGCSATAGHDQIKSAVHSAFNYRK